MEEELSPGTGKTQRLIKCNDLRQIEKQNSRILKFRFEFFVAS